MEERKDADGSVELWCVPDASYTDRMGGSREKSPSFLAAFHGGTPLWVGPRLLRVERAR